MTDPTPLTPESEALLAHASIRARFLNDVTMGKPRPGSIPWLRDELIAIEAAVTARGYPCELLAGGSCQLQRDIRAIEQAAAARAVDEALSGLATLADPGSGGYVRIERGTTGWTLNCEGGDTGPWHEGDTIRDAIAAALVAHLRGPR